MLRRWSFPRPPWHPRLFLAGKKGKPLACNSRERTFESGSLGEMVSWCSHGCYGVVWLVAWCVLATLKLNFTPAQKQDTYPKKAHIVLQSTQFSVGRFFWGAKKIGRMPMIPKNPLTFVNVLWWSYKRTYSKKNVKNPLDLRSFGGVFLKSLPK